MSNDNIDIEREELENAEAAENETVEEAPELTDAEKIEQLGEALEAEKDKYLRKVAEFENFRKRTIKEKTELILNGGEKLMTALLPVLDDLERAEQNIATATDTEALRQGLELIFDKLRKTLTEQGLKKIDTVGRDFDTDFHEAIALVPATSDEQKGKIIDCVQEGYCLNEKVIRHARVAVGQ